MKTLALLAVAVVVLYRAMPACAETTFRIMSYNIHHAEGTDGIVDLDRVVELIRESAPDVVCLQEVDRNLPRTGKADFPAELARKLNMHVVFESNYAFDGGEYGNATLSKFPIVSSANNPLPRMEGREPRGCLRTTIGVGGGMVDVLNTHFGLVGDERKQQAAAVLGLLTGDRPAILAGDLNEPAHAAALQTLTMRLRDTLPGSSDKSIPGKEGSGNRIDFILLTEGLETLSSHIVSTPLAEKASDHFPVVAEIMVKPISSAAPSQGVYDSDDERVEESIERGT
jgi:endonuclease/exonuclease/phosphatase family metal-dependent hydrolase